MVTLRPRIPKKQEPQDTPVVQKKKPNSSLIQKKKQVSVPLQRNEKGSKKRSWSRTNEFGYPVGLRFNPTETELVGYYLHSRIARGKNFQTDFVTECIDFYDTEPWVIWENSVSGDTNKGDKILYFFACRKWRSVSSTRFDRRVGLGTWSAQNARDVYDDDEEEAIGVRRDFKYEGGNEKVHNKAWLLQEYQIANDDEIVLCALRKSPRHLPPTANKNKSSYCAQKTKTNVGQPRVKRCKVEERSDDDDEEQGSCVDRPKMEENPLELAQDHPIMQQPVPYEELNGYQDCYYPEPYPETNTYSSDWCDDSYFNLVSTHQGSDDLLAMVLNM